MKSRSKTLFVVLPILLLCVGGIWYWRKNADDRAAMSYLTETVRRGEILATVNASGELDAVVSVDVGAQVSGQIERLYVELGQQVKKGDLIAEIDSTTQRNELEKSKAQLASYEAQLAARKTALDIAQTRYNRELKLRRSDSTSRENLESAQQTLASARADVAEMESQITQTRLAVSTAETYLGYTIISAPLDGTVDRTGTVRLEHVPHPTGRPEFIDTVDSDFVLLKLVPDLDPSIITFLPDLLR